MQPKRDDDKNKAEKRSEKPSKGVPGEPLSRYKGTNPRTPFERPRDDQEPSTPSKGPSKGA